MARSTGCEIIEDMTTATSVEKPRPTDIGITTPETAEAAVVAKVERLLREHDPNRPLGQVRPVTAVTPVPPSADLATVQAERVGSQEPIINPADVAHNVKIARSLFTGESIWARIGRAFGWVNLIKRRAAQKRTAQKAYKPIDI
ncbi:hypothetical protein HYS96_00590 [Candidatus Daviesbacteria bacterium]|nr:hypothetical protein [Candidatus Daviesbacteria bacterium]